VWDNKKQIQSRIKQLKEKEVSASDVDYAIKQILEFTKTGKREITIINVGDQVLRDILINLSSGSKIGV